MLNKFIRKKSDNFKLLHQYTFFNINKLIPMNTIGFHFIMRDPHSCFSRYSAPFATPGGKPRTFRIREDERGNGVRNGANIC